MRRLLPSNNLRKLAAAVVLTVICATGYSQISSRGPVIIIEPTVVGQMMGRTLATGNASLVTLGNPAEVVVGRSNAISGQNPLSGLMSSPSLRYFITDLGTLGGTQSFAYALNDWGQVVGESWTAGDTASHAFLYNGDRMTDLYPLNSGTIQTVGPTKINNFGQIASGVIRDGVYVPAVYNSITGILSPVTPLGGVTSYGFNGVATSINNVGTVVGYSYIDSLNRHAFVSGVSGTSDLGSFGGYSAALAINDLGTIVGFASDQYNGVAHAFVYSGGVMTNIHPSTESYARSVNNFGAVVGEYLTTDHSAFHAFLYRGGSFTDLGLAGSTETTPFAINDRSQIVGIVYDVAGNSHGFLYNDGAFVDLNSVIQEGSGWDLVGAYDINNVGQIVGSGVINNRYHAYLLTPAISKDQCKSDGWKRFGFINQGDCIQFVNTGK